MTHHFIFFVVKDRFRKIKWVQDMNQYFYLTLSVEPAENSAICVRLLWTKNKKGKKICVVLIFIEIFCYKSPGATCLLTKDISQYYWLSVCCVLSVSLIDWQKVNKTACIVCTKLPVLVLASFLLRNIINVTNLDRWPSWYVTYLHNKKTWPQQPMAIQWMAQWIFHHSRNVIAANDNHQADDPKY